MLHQETEILLKLKVLGLLLNEIATRSYNKTKDPNMKVKFHAYFAVSTLVCHYLRKVYMVSISARCNNVSPARNFRRLQWHYATICHGPHF